MIPGATTAVVLQRLPARSLLACHLLALRARLAEECGCWAGSRRRGDDSDSDDEAASKSTARALVDDCLGQLRGDNADSSGCGSDDGWSDDGWSDDDS